jgi:hypothetical protein
MKMAKEEEKWTPYNCYDKAMEVFNASGLPAPAVVKIDKLEFPMEVEDVTSPALGTLLFEFGALKAYAANKVTEWDIKYHAMKRARDIRQGHIVGMLQKSTEIRLLKDALESQAIHDDEMLNSLVKHTEQAVANYKQFQSAYEQYSIYWDTVSREITRRSDELKSFMRQEYIQ